jgi:hypothetical protein
MGSMKIVVGLLDALDAIDLDQMLLDYHTIVATDEQPIVVT